MVCAHVGVMDLRRPIFASALVTALGMFAVGCSSSSEEAVDNTDDALETDCDRPAVPDTLDGLSKYSACQLQKLFESDEAKAATAEHGIPKGAYDGIPLCRKEVLRTVKSEQMPAGVKAIGGAKLIYDLLKLSDTFDNTIAKEIWHGKNFTPAGDVVGDVNNFIDFTTDEITADTKTSAEAKYFIDPDHKWLVLDYQNAATGLPFLKKVSVELIRQVYDTARLVDKEKGIWVGMAWMVDKPGKYTPEVPNTVIPSCYFALKKHQF